MPNLQYPEGDPEVVALPQAMCAVTTWVVGVGEEVTSEDSAGASRSWKP